MVGVKTKSEKTKESSFPPCGCLQNEEGYWAILCPEAEELWNSSFQAKYEGNPELYLKLHNAYFDHMRKAQSKDNSFLGGANG